MLPPNFELKNKKLDFSSDQNSLFCHFFCRKLPNKPSKVLITPPMTYITGKLLYSRKVWHPGWGVRGRKPVARFFSMCSDRSESLSVDCLLHISSSNQLNNWKLTFMQTCVSCSDTWIQVYVQVYYCLQCFETKK